MNWFRRLLSKRELERKLQAESQDHFDRQTADNLRAGMSEQQALRDAALRCE